MTEDPTAGESSPHDAGNGTPAGDGLAANAHAIGGDDREPWTALLDDAGPHDHIVQLYQDEQFLSRAVCRFAAGALAHGEGLILVPTAAHWKAFRPRLEAEGVDVEAVQKQGQLTIVDANELLPRFVRDAMPDGPVFLGLATEVIEKAQGNGRFPRVRWWGEMVNVLWERGDVAASMRLEDLFQELGRQLGVALFCSFTMDNFSGDVNTRMLPRLGENHSHLIPAEDYVRLERAVLEALRETVGKVEASVLENVLLERRPTPLSMPRPQALLLALYEALPLVAETVLSRSRQLYGPDAADRSSTASA